MDQPQTSSPSDLPAKYQKLATEYSKMRAQVTVLKKGVTDEQAKSNELRLELKEKDQSLRKLEQEVECLNFRNQQLEKRVSVLQEDLELLELSKKSKSSKNMTTKFYPADDQSFAVLNTELQSKIDENAKLHSKLQSLESSYGYELEEVRRELQDLKCSSSAKLKSQEEMIEHQKSTLSQINQEKIRIETKFSSCQDELEKAKQLTQKFLGKSVSDANEDNEGSENIIIHLKGRITELIDNQTAAESKALLFHAECNRMKSRLKNACDEKNAAEDSLQNNKDEHRSLKDELSTTVRNYETQLSAMSDHLASMNEKWTAQQNEMDSLKSLMNGSYNSRKSKHK